MRVLIVTKIFPNALEPLSAPFNRQQFRELSRLCDLEVLATIPWFPGATAFKRWSMAGRLAAVPEQEQIDGMRVRHPRTLFVPRLGHGLAGPLYAASLAAVLDKRPRADVVLGSWAYPDGYAAVRLAAALNIASVVKLHGSDMDVVAQLPGPRKRLSWALPRASAVVAVSHPLARAAIELGADPERVAVIANGIDASLFTVRPRATARRALLLDPARRLILFVGRIQREKGVYDLLSAFDRVAARNPQADLALVGDGAALTACRRRAAAFGDRVRVVGPRPLAVIPTWLAACDILALPSWHEGMPNAVLEALACGRRVIATRVGGIPDVIRDAELGALVEPRQPSALAEALLAALSVDYDPVRVRERAGIPSWRESAERLCAVLAEAAAARDRQAA